MFDPRKTCPPWSRRRFPPPTYLLSRETFLAVEAGSTLGGREHRSARSEHSEHRTFPEGTAMAPTRARVKYLARDSEATRGFFVSPTGGGHFSDPCTERITSGEVAEDGAVHAVEKPQACPPTFSGFLPTFEDPSKCPSSGDLESHHQATFSLLWPRFPAHLSLGLAGDQALAGRGRAEGAGVTSGHALKERCALGHGGPQMPNLPGGDPPPLPAPSCWGRFCWTLRDTRVKFSGWSRSTRCPHRLSWPHGQKP